MNKKIIITGSTGMVGKGVLLECLDSTQIEKVLVINRSSIHMQHPKLEEILLPDFLNVASLKNQLDRYDACFHCMGVSSVGMSEEDYTKITYEVTKNLADLMYELNPAMTFIYVSGTGTDSSEKGRSMWARVKGKTENYILNKGFKQALMFRPGAIIPEKGIKSRTGLYNFIYFIIRPLFPFLRNSKSITTTTKLGQAMINSLSKSTTLTHFENQDINQLA